MNAAGNTEVLWTAAEAAAATGGGSTGDWQATGVSIDSRSLARGDLFVALAGPSFDGHDFVGAAFEAGAAAAMVHRDPTALPKEAALLRVEDTLEGLTAMGHAARARSAARFAAVTGSVGKTGTKEALRACLAAQAPTAASAASFNNHWGVPLSLARMSRQAVYGVFELGMNHPGEIRQLVRIVRPHVAVITTIQPAHMAFFRDLFEIADAKAEIFEGVEPGGAAVLNRDSPFFAHLVERAEKAGLTRILSFGRHPDASVRLADCSLHATSSAVQAVVEGTPLDYRISQPGEHWVINSLAVLAAVSALGANLAVAAAELARLQPLKGRGAREELACGDGSFVLIDESYNANPASMRAAIEVLGRSEPGEGGRRIAVLGDMLELGDNADELHAGLVKPLEDGGIDLVFACGPHMAALHEALPPSRRGAHAADSEALAPQAAGAIRPGDVVMVKGSLGSRMARVVEALKTIGAPSLRAANGE